MTQTLKAAESYYAWSARVADRAVEESSKAAQGGGALALGAAALVVAQHQAAAALEAPAAAASMLLEQGIKRPAEARLRPLAFVTPPSSIEAMMRSIQDDIAASLAEPPTSTQPLNAPASPGGVDRLLEAADRAAEQLLTDWRFERLVESLVQDAAREAQQVDVVTRPRIAHVRHLVLPSCSRCAVLAGRIYRWSEGFQRHPGCDCVMVPTTLANDSLVYDIDGLARDGQITGLSKADREAIALGADFNQVANSQRGRGSVRVAGRTVGITDEGTTRRGFAYSALSRRSTSPVVKRPGERYSRTSSVRLTPASILDAAKGDRDEALRLFKLHGYIQ